MPRPRSSLPIIVAGIAACGYIPAPAFAQAEFAGSEVSAVEGFDNSDGMLGFDAGIEGLGTKVADEDLSQMRGKFATPNGIGYFGLEMSTSWQTPDGITTQARLAINFDFAGGNRTPQVFVSWQRDEGEETLDVRSFGQQAQGGYVALTNSGAVPVGGLDTVRGAVQSQQIAGDDNSVRNAMTVAIVPIAEARINTAGMTPLNASSARSFADGDTLRFVVNGKEVGIVLTGNGTDAVSQKVSSQGSQLAQHARINSDDNDIVSRMSLTIGQDPAAHANRSSVSNLLSAMRGNGY
jgi:hypothetical protein